MKIAYPASVVVFSMPKSVRILCHLSQLNHCLTVVLSLRKRALPRKLAHVFYIVIMNKHLFVCFLAVHVSNSCFRTLAVILVWDFSLSLSLKHKHKSSSQFYTQHNEEEEEDERKKERQKGRRKETEGNAAFSGHSHAQADTHTKRNAHAAGPTSSRLSHHAYPPQCCPFLVQALTQSQRPTIAVKRLPAPRAQKKEGKTTLWEIEARVIGESLHSKSRSGNFRPNSAIIIAYPAEGTCTHYLHASACRLLSSPSERLVY